MNSTIISGDNQVTFTLTYQELVAASQLISRSKKTFHLVAWVVVITMAFVCWGAIARWNRGIAWTFHDTVMVCDALMKWFLVVFVSLWLAQMLDRWLFIPWRSKRIYRELLAKGLETGLVWSDAGLEWRFNHGNAQFAWKDYIRRQESKLVLILYETTFGPAWIIPKRAISIAQWNDLRAYLDAIPTKQ